MSHLYERLYSLLRAKALRKKSRRMALLGQGLGHMFQFGVEADERAVQSFVFPTLIKSGNGELTGLPVSWWTGYISVVKADPATYEAEEFYLLAQTRELDVNLIPAASWLELYRLCLISGLFKVGLEIRRKAERRVLHEAASESGPVALRLALAVALETGGDDSGLHFLQRLAQCGESSEAIAHGKWLIHTLKSGERITCLRSVGDAVVAEQVLLDKLQGKRLAVVGPAPTRQNSGAEIDSFDLVSKFNYRGGSLGCDPGTQGRRVDIAYYNIEQSKYIARQMSQAFLGDLPFPVFIKPKGLRVLKQWTRYGRTVRNLQWLLLDSEFNAGPNAVYDLLRFAPQELKVFNSDLMLTAGRFAGYWQPGAKEVNYCYSFAITHDPVLQFRYFRRAWDAGLITGDSVFSRVMQMTLDEYISELQLAHGGIGRESICPAPKSQVLEQDTSTIL